MKKRIIVEKIEDKIFHIRGKNIMLDENLAQLYSVETKQLTRQVRRHSKRFPEDFMFRLTKSEYLRCQFGTSKRGGRRYLPYAFTEQGVAMLSGVLNSQNAIIVNIQIMRAFISMRRIALTYTTLKRKIDSIEKKYDAKFGTIFAAIKNLLKPIPIHKRRKIGFHSQ